VRLFRIWHPIKASGTMPSRHHHDRSWRSCPAFKSRKQANIARPRSVLDQCRPVRLSCSIFNRSRRQMECEYPRTRARRGTILLLLFSLVAIAIRRYTRFTIAAQQRQSGAAVGSKAKQISCVHVQTQTQTVNRVEAQTQTQETQRYLRAQTQTQEIQSSSPELQTQHDIGIQMPNEPQLHVVAHSRTASRAHRRRLASAARMHASTHVSNAA